MLRSGVAGTLLGALDYAYAELRGLHVPKDCSFGGQLTGSYLYQSFSDQLLQMRGAQRSQTDIDQETTLLRDMTCTKLISQQRDTWIEKWRDFSREDACELVLRNDGWYYVSCAARTPALIFDDDTYSPGGRRRRNQ